MLRVVYGRSSRNILYIDGGPKDGRRIAHNHELPNNRCHISPSSPQQQPPISPHNPQTHIPLQSLAKLRPLSKRRTPRHRSPPLNPNLVNFLPPSPKRPLAFNTRNNPQTTPPPPSALRSTAAQRPARRGKDAADSLLTIAFREGDSDG